MARPDIIIFRNIGLLRLFQDQIDRIRVIPHFTDSIAHIDNSVRSCSSLIKQCGKQGNPFTVIVKSDMVFGTLQPLRFFQIFPERLPEFFIQTFPGYVHNSITVNVYIPQVVQYGQKDGFCRYMYQENLSYIFFLIDITSSDRNWHEVHVTDNGHFPLPDWLHELKR